ncbi:unnamed protein product, partial [Prorocentrum cordatum]
MKEGEAMYRAAHALAAYAAGPSRPHSSARRVPGDENYRRADRATEVAAFPGGAVDQLFGVDASKSAYDLVEQAQGPAAAGLLQPMALASQGLGLGGGLLQDTSGSGPDVRAFQDAQSFRGRLAHLVGEAEADADMASKFARAANQILGASQEGVGGMQIAGTSPKFFGSPSAPAQEGLRRASAAAFASARSGQDVSDIEAETVRLDALRKE